MPELEQKMRPGDWLQSIEYDEPCRVVSVQTVWDERVVTVWLPLRAEVTRVSAERLRSLEDSDGGSLHHLSYVCAAARIIDSLERDALAAPLEASVIPLPHQLHALQRAVSGDGIRYLLADEVGLGKTIEAGLILRELKVRNRSGYESVVGRSEGGSIPWSGAEHALARKLRTSRP